MFCVKCGKNIDDSAVVCVYCGVATKNLESNQPPQQPQSQPIVINNNTSSSASAAAAASSSSGSGRFVRRYSLGFDIFMIIITCGLWVIWMLLRPKYY